MNMKKLTILSILVLSSGVTYGQSPDEQWIDKDMLKICIGVGATFLFLFLLLEFVRYFFDYRLREKAINQGISEEMAAIIFPSENKSRQNRALRWSLLMAGLGVGLIVVKYTSPLGFHSPAIMFFAVSIANFLYYSIISRADKR